MIIQEYEYLMSLKKFFCASKIVLPQNDSLGTYDLGSENNKEQFILDVNRKGRIELSKFKLQERYGKTKLPLVRLELNAPPHTNPDGFKTSRNHIHILKDEDDDTYNLPWAYNLDNYKDEFSSVDSDNFMEVFLDFCKYCNIHAEGVQGII